MYLKFHIIKTQTQMYFIWVKYKLKIISWKNSMPSSHEQKQFDYIELSSFTLFSVFGENKR